MHGGKFVAGEQANQIEPLQHEHFTVVHASGATCINSDPGQALGAPEATITRPQSTVGVACKQV